MRLLGRIGFRMSSSSSSYLGVRHRSSTLSIVARDGNLDLALAVTKLVAVELAWVEEQDGQRERHWPVVRCVCLIPQCDIAQGYYHWR